MRISTSISGSVRPSVCLPLRLFIFGDIDVLFSTVWPVLALVLITFSFQAYWHSRRTGIPGLLAFDCSQLTGIRESFPGFKQVLHLRSVNLCFYCLSFFLRWFPLRAPASQSLRRWRHFYQPFSDGRSHLSVAEALRHFGNRLETSSTEPRAVIMADRRHVLTPI